MKPTEQQILDSLLKRIEEYLLESNSGNNKDKIVDLSPETEFLTLGIDSLEFRLVSLDLEEELSCLFEIDHVPFERFSGITVRGLAKLLEENIV